MTASFDLPITCPVLIGRAAPLASLERLAVSASAGRGSVVTITGDAGIGKSRLASEVGRRFMTRATATGRSALALSGRCFEPDRAAPYAPIHDLLRGFIASQPSAELVRPRASLDPLLARLLPELADRWPELAAQPVPDADLEPRRLHEALARLALDLAARGPVLILIEDLHWSDDASLDALRVLARRVVGQPVLLLLTYRADEVEPALAGLLADLTRERLVTEFGLDRLTRDETGSMLRAIFGLDRPVGAAFLESLHGLTEGNPFFIEEVIRSLVAAGDIGQSAGAWDRKPLPDRRIPRTVWVAVQRRVERLTPSARHLLTLAAVAGRRFDFALLQAVTGHDEADLLALVKQLMAAQVVVEESAETFAFRHALTRQAIYADLLARERIELHRAVLAALIGRAAAGSPPRPAGLAYHAVEAGDWAATLTYARQAGERAAALFAPRAAVEHFNRAVMAAHRLGQPVAPALWRARARAHGTLGAFELALADQEAGLAAARAIGDRLSECQGVLDLGWLWTERDYAQAGTLFSQAVALARTTGDLATLAQTLNRVGNWHLHNEATTEARHCHEEALAIYRKLDQAQGLATTLDLLGITSYMSGDVAAGVTALEQAVTLWRHLDERRGLIESLAPLALRGSCALFKAVAPVAADPAACQREIEQALGLARQIGWRAGEAMVLAYLGLILGPRGEAVAGWTAAAAGLAIAEELNHRTWAGAAHVALAGIRLDLCDTNGAIGHLEANLRLSREMGSAFTIGQATGLLVSALVVAGDLAAAGRTLDGLLTPTTPFQTIAQRDLWCARAELALASDRPAEALAILDRLADSPVGAMAGLTPIPCVGRLHGQALRALGRLADAEAVLIAARAVADRQGQRPLCWRIDADLARLQAAQGRRAEAIVVADAARATIEALATSAPVALRDDFRRRALAVLPRLPALSPRRAAKLAFGGLTERERAVAALIAQGHSNRAAAEALFVSERTVEKHVENILGKLRFTTRAQIAAWAVETGLGDRAE